MKGHPCNDGCTTDVGDEESLCYSCANGQCYGWEGDNDDTDEEDKD